MPGLEQANNLLVKGCTELAIMKGVWGAHPYSSTRGNLRERSWHQDGCLAKGSGIRQDPTSF